MNIILARRIKMKLQKELMKRKLVEYFAVKGHDNFGTPLYPPSVYDLPVRVPELFNRVEIVPCVDDIDTGMGTVTLSWKMFVLGTNLIELGKSTHIGESDVLRAVMGEPNVDLPAERVTSPKAVINFILKILSNSKTGFIELPENFQIPPEALTLPLLSKARSPRIAPTASGAFYSR